jgi:hypothetical protein
MVRDLNDRGSDLIAMVSGVPALVSYNSQLLAIFIAKESSDDVRGHLHYSRLFAHREDPARPKNEFNTIRCDR